MLLALVADIGTADPAATQPRRQAGQATAASRLIVRVERHAEGAPLVFGVPFPKGALDSPDHVRLVDAAGREVPSQISEVSTWEPAGPSLKWIWVFFFAGQGNSYALEYGPAVRRAQYRGPQLSVINNQRPGGYVMVDTGPMKFEVRKGAGGFLGRVQVDRDRNGFDDSDLVAEADPDRGSFLDLLGDDGLDPSRAFVERMAIERGSGPLHTIVRIEGEYRYRAASHPPAPFVTRIHAYAGRTVVRVDHTFIFTGEPDRHTRQEGEHSHIATQAGRLIAEKAGDPGWMQPKDRLASAGLAVRLTVSKPSARTSVGEGRWWERRPSRMVDVAGGSPAPWSLLQTGPEPDRIPPVPESSPTARMGGFAASVQAGETTLASADRTDGWFEVIGGARRVSTTLPRVLEEYPKEIRFDEGSGALTAFFWSPRVEPMSFARFSTDLDREEETIAIENTAQGVAKTSEAVFDFASDGGAGVPVPAQAFIVPPVAHVDPGWYGASGAFGRFAPASGRFPEYQRALDYKFEWMLFNQRWAPWYGMWDYGDWKLYFDGRQWAPAWGNNEPGEDFICWLQFMRTGDPRMYDAARANSRHSMDVDNIHWPPDPVYRGDSNSALDYFVWEQSPPGNKYLGIGSRHANQHWVRTLSAHVWAMGWLADYYLAADHRGLDVAIQTADMHLKRIWGEHGLTGRRLYLAAWNVMEVWDATKRPKYRTEIDDYVERMLALQDREQGGSLSMDRYGYADVYITHALAKYLDLTGDTRVRSALARHARRVRDVPALNHEFESYMSGVYALALGWDITGEPSLLAEVRRRLDPLATDALPRPVDDTWTQAALFEALDGASHLPRTAVRGTRAMPIWSATNGLRVFGWTHAYTLPFALERLGRADPEATRPGRPRPDAAGGR